MSKVFAPVYVDSDIDVWEKHDASSFDEEDGSSTFTRNVGNRVHFRKMSAPQNRVNIDTDRPLKPEISTAGQSANKESSMRCKKCSLTL